LHIGGDFFIWLSFIAIPLVLLYFTRRRDLPHRRVFVLFALALLACGFGHLIDALMFQYPVYRLAGVWTVVTAILSWATVLALLPVVPRVMAAAGVPRAASSFGDTTLHRLAAPAALVRTKDYIIAILAGVLALLVRAAVDPILQSDHVYVLSLLAVVFVSWQCGFGPGILTLFISMTGTIFFFMPPRRVFVVEGLGNQLATAMFFFVGVCCAALGEAQRLARRRARVALEVALERKAELEAEVARRYAVEDALRQSEAQYRTLAEKLERLVQERTAALVAEIEERKRAEQQVREVATELERSNGELEQFAYIASHDLQEPLRKIQAFGDRLRNRYRAELPDGGKEYVDRMHNSAARMRRLIDDLLSYSRVTTTARPFRRVDLAELVREVVADLDERIEQTGATVEIGELPPIAADPSQMRQLFQNLLVNAVKFQRPDVPPVVEIRGELITDRLSPSDDEPVPACRITVRDNGIGFDEKYLDRIFQVFQRLHGREEYEGTGVGLAICRKIVERHGGTITARSRIGEGTTFVVTLPIRQPREEATADVQLDQEPGHDPGGR
jgi:signal transduction histidine kinase